MHCSVRKPNVVTNGLHHFGTFKIISDISKNRMYISYMANMMELGLHIYI